MAIREALSWVKEVGWFIVITEPNAQLCFPTVIDSSYTDDSVFQLLAINYKTLLSEECILSLLQNTRIILLMHLLE